MVRVFHLPEGSFVTRTTTAADVKGWDSLSHAMLVLNVEEEFGIDLPLDRTYGLSNVGELVDLVNEALGGSGPRSIIIVGNAQAESLSLAMSHIPAIADRFRVRYYEPEHFAADPPSGDDLASCRAFFEQHAATSVVDRGTLPADCAYLTFPDLSFNALWPFTVPNTYALPEPPEYPSGRFPYGHRLVIEALDRGDDADQTLAVVAPDRWDPDWPDPEKVLAAEAARLNGVDAECDVAIGDYVMAHFRDRRLFWAVNLPANALLEELLARLLDAALEDDAPARTEIAAAFAATGNRDLLGVTSVPIHPKIAERLQLAWFDRDERHLLLDQTRVSYEEYFRRMVESGVRARDAHPDSKVRYIRRTAIVFGNCQADALALTLSRLGSHIKGLRVLYWPSYDKPGGFAPISEDDVRSADVLFEQQDPQTFPLRSLLPDSCRKIKFPSLDFNLLWPLNCVNPYNRPEPPAYPLGRFSYGNSLVVHGVERGLPRDEILASVLSPKWEAHWPNLDRLFSIETARLTARDAQCSVKMASYVLENFREQRLFWTANHPTNRLFAEFCARMLEIGFGPDVSGGISVADVLAGIGEKDLLGIVGVPIHPHVARHFRLKWYSKDERYPFFDEAPLTYEEYFTRMIDASLEVAGEKAPRSA